ncbi:hypothetical protein [Fulvivirga sp.]|uniref:hypothetical protein n=1 Tax=Fulvivirga sp. TaxID=1931237 RepID=UPI0032F093B5
MDRDIMPLPWIINRPKLYAIGAVILILLSPYWVYNNLYHLLFKYSPFKNLDNKVVVDGVSITDYNDYNNLDIDEIYIVNTIDFSIRQITNDKYINKNPILKNGLIYFESNRNGTMQDFIYSLEIDSIWVNNK